MRKNGVFFILAGLVLVSCVYLTYVYLSPPHLKQIKEFLRVPSRRYLVEPLDIGYNSSNKPFRGLIESFRLDKLCADVNRTITSETKPPFYPYDGIGKPATLADDEYDTSHFRHYCSKDLSAIVTAYSAAQNFDRRKAIRDTIGKQCEVHNCKVLFILAISSDQDIAAKVKAEYEEKKDMFMKNKIDTYVDLNNKAVAMLDWLLEFCQEPKYVIHLIDDAFVNVKMYLQGLMKMPDSQRYVYGKIFLNQRPHRNQNSIYYVSPQVYPMNKYPDFIVGISYAFPNSLTRELRCAVHKAKYVWLEDVWLLGEIKEYLGFKLVQSEYESWHIGFETLDINKVRDMIYLHNTGVSDFYRFNQALDSK